MDTITRNEMKWRAALGDRDAARLLSEESQSVAASFKALGDAMERNRWAQSCRGLTPAALGKTPEGNLSFIRDTVTRLHSTEAAAWRRRTYEAAIFAIGAELDRRKLAPPATAAAAPAKATAAPAEPLTVTDSMLFKIALGCVKLDAKTRGKPSHWEVFLAAWKEGMNDYDMAARKKWPRRTAGNRLRAVEVAHLGGAKVSELRFDPAILRNVEAQLKAAHDCNATKTRAAALLDNTGDEDA